MSRREIENLRLELERLKIVTGQIRRDYTLIRTENQLLSDRIRNLEQENTQLRRHQTANYTEVVEEAEDIILTAETPSRVHTRASANRDTINIGQRGRTIQDFQVGDRIEVIKPTCPGRGRRPNITDKFANVTRVAGEWVYFICDSGVETKRHPKNIILAQRRNDYFL